MRWRIEEILDRVSDAFYAVDRELRIVYVNRRLEELIQQPRGELIGRSIGDVFPDESDGGTIADDLLPLGMRSRLDLNPFPKSSAGGSKAPSIEATQVIPSTSAT